MKLRCYCCGEEIEGPQVVLVSYSEPADRAFIFKPAHAARVDTAAHFLTVSLPERLPAGWSPEKFDKLLDDDIAERSRETVAELAALAAAQLMESKPKQYPCFCRPKNCKLTSETLPANQYCKRLRA